VQVLEIFGRQLLDSVRPLPGLHVVEVHGVRNRRQIQPRTADLRLLEALEDVEADGAGDSGEDHQHHHDLDQRHAARGRLAGLSQMFANMCESSTGE